MPHILVPHIFDKIITMTEPQGTLNMAGRYFYFLIDKGATYFVPGKFSGLLSANPCEIMRVNGTPPIKFS